MASPKVMNGTLAASDETFPAADAQAELHPAQNKDFQVDPVSSDVATTSMENKERAEERRKKKAEERTDALQTLKSTIIVSGAILAVVGAVFVVTKKLKATSLFN